jgi:hypothetical protein
MSILSVVRLQLALKFSVTQKTISCVAMAMRTLGAVMWDPNHAPPLRASSPLWGCTLHAYSHGDLRQWLALLPHRDQSIYLIALCFISYSNAQLLCMNSNHGRRLKIWKEKGSKIRQENTENSLVNRTTTSNAIHIQSECLSFFYDFSLREIC